MGRASLHCKRKARNIALEIRYSIAIYSERKQMIMFYYRCAVVSACLLSLTGAHAGQYCGDLKRDSAAYFACEALNRQEIIEQNRLREQENSDLRARIERQTRDAEERSRREQERTTRERERITQEQNQEKQQHTADLMPIAMRLDGAMKAIAGSGGCDRAQQLLDEARPLIASSRPIYFTDGAVTTKEQLRDVLIGLQSSVYVKCLNDPQRTATLLPYLDREAKGGSQLAKKLFDEMKQEIAAEVDKTKSTDSNLQQALLADDRKIAEQLLGKVYGTYDKRNKCWYAKKNTGDREDQLEQRFCMKLSRIDKLTTMPMPRYHVLALGIAIEADGHQMGGRFTPGMVGAFVAEVKNGQPAIVASNSAMLLGSFANPPSDWSFVQLGASDYWGWQTEVLDGGQGNVWGRYVILAPNGKQISNLAHRLASSKSEVEGEDGTKGMNLETALRIDSSKTSEQVFPLLLTVSGEFNGQKVTPKTWNIKFDTKTWRYIPPKQWPPTSRRVWAP